MIINKDCRYLYWTFFCIKLHLQLNFIEFKFKLESVLVLRTSCYLLFQAAKFSFCAKYEFVCDGLISIIENADLFNRN